LYYPSLFRKPVVNIKVATTGAKKNSVMGPILTRTPVERKGKQENEIKKKLIIVNNYWKSEKHHY